MSDASTNTERQRLENQRTGKENWRGPIWMPTNFLLVQALEKYYRFLGPNFEAPVPCLGGQRLDLKAIATLLAERLVAMGRYPHPLPRRHAQSHSRCF